MYVEKVHLRHCFFYEFQLNHTAAEAHRNISIVCGKEAINDSTCHRWFTMLCSGDTKFRFGGAVELDDEALLALLETDSRQTILKLAAQRSTSH